jgi:hypothetical protein
MNLFLYNVIFKILVYISQKIRTNLENKKYTKKKLCYVTNVFNNN